MNKEGQGRLQPLFERARRLLSKDTPRFLLQVRKQDPRLARELEQLLREEAGAEEGQQEARATGLIDSTELRAEGARQIREGSLLNGTYLLQNRLGSGAMGEVWLAKDQKWRGRPMAIKFLRPAEGVDTAGALERVFDEADVLLSLTHENILRLYTLDRIGRIPFLVMEYLAGSDLSDIVQARGENGGEPKLSHDEVFWVLEQLQPALDFAHSRGIAHRDIKPGNVMLDAPVEGPIDKGGVRAKLTDFGIAVPVDGAATIQAAGTPFFMAPEIFTGQPLSKRDLLSADVYSLGATLYNLLAGVPPFTASTRDELFQRIRHDKPARLSANETRLEAAILQALHKAPSGRPESARAFLAKATNRPKGPRVSTTVLVQRPDGIGADASAPATPLLFVSREERFTPNENHVLQIGVINTGVHAVTCELTVSAALPEALTVFSPERELRLASRSEGWALVSFRVHERGRQEINVQLAVRDERGWTRVWRVPEARLFVDAGAGSTRGLFCHPAACIEREFEGQVAELYRRLVSSVDGSRSVKGQAMQELRLERPSPAWGVLPRTPEHMRGRQLRVVLLRDCKLQRRLRVLFLTQCSLGRVATVQGSGDRIGRNQLVPIWLPCRSRAEDPENFRRNLLISRFVGVISADERKTSIRSSSETLAVQGRPLRAGLATHLRSGVARVLTLGEGFELEVQAFRAPPEDVCTLLSQRSEGRSLSRSDVFVRAPYHHAVRLRRLSDDVPVEYLMAMPWVGIGGGLHDVGYVAGMPGRTLLLAHAGGAIHALANPACAGALEWNPPERMWRPLRAGDRFESGPWQLSFWPSKSVEMGQERDLLEAAGGAG